MINDDQWMVNEVVNDEFPIFDGFCNGSLATLAILGVCCNGHSSHLQFPASKVCFSCISGRSNDLQTAAENNKKQSSKSYVQIVRNCSVHMMIAQKSNEYP